ncbi:hypothetical protein ABK040_007036 [Willaertia magna]
MRNYDSDNEEETKYQFKVIILGDGAVGKTSITKRFTSDEFKLSYLQTVGVDWFLKNMLLKDLRNNTDVEVTLQLWDIGGQQLGSKLLSNYIYGSDAVVLTYDMTSYASFKNLEEWFKLVQQVLPNINQTDSNFNRKGPILCLMANKSDLSHERSVRRELHEKWADKYGMKSFFVSAKTGENVNTSFFTLAAALVGIPLSNRVLSAETKVVTAPIINYEVTDAENEELKRSEARQFNNVDKKKRCIIA